MSKPRRAPGPGSVRSGAQARERGVARLRRRVGGLEGGAGGGARRVRHDRVRAGVRARARGGARAGRAAGHRRGRASRRRGFRGMPRTPRRSSTFVGIGRVPRSLAPRRARCRGRARPRGRADDRRQRRSPRDGCRSRPRGRGRRTQGVARWRGCSPRSTTSELAERLRGEAVIARATPEDKLRLVRVLQDRGEAVAVTGDGSIPHGVWTSKGYRSHF